MHRVVLSFSAVVLAGCTFDAPPLGMTEFRCGPSAGCPDDHACMAGVCRPDPMAPGAADARPAADATITADAGAADDAPAEARTLRFGDHPSSTDPGTLVDTYLSAELPTSSLGAAASVVVDDVPLRVGLVRIDVSAIAPGARVESATLVVVMRDGLETGALDLHALRLAWDPAAATYQQWQSGVTWPVAGAGGDAAAPEAIASIAPRQAVEARVDLPAAVVQGWVDAPASNLGLRVQVTGSTTSGCSWNSADHPTPELRPYLEVVVR
jgi:hypothetical protein